MRRKRSIRSQAFDEVKKNADKIMVGGKDGDKAARKVYRKGAAKAVANKTGRAAKTAVKALGRGAKTAAKRVVGPIGLAFGAADVIQGRVPYVQDVKDLYDYARSDDADLVVEAFKEDPVGMTKEMSKEIGRSIKATNKEMVEEANERRSRDFHKEQKSVEGFAKGGAVKKRLGRGCGIAVQGTKFRGVK